MDLIPQPKSKFLKVKCRLCDNEMIIFNHSKSKVVCNSSDCSHLIAEPAGGKAFIDAEIIEELK